MRLTDTQLAESTREGTLFLPGVFKAAEIAARKAEQNPLPGLPLASHLRAQSGEFPGPTAMDRESAL